MMAVDRVAFNTEVSRSQWVAVTGLVGCGVGGQNWGAAQKGTAITMTEQHSEMPPNEENPSDRSSQVDSFETYQKIADTVGLVPSLRWKDNLIQAIIVVGSAAIGGLVGLLVWGPFGAAGLAIAGLILGTLLSGFAFMILGWIRAAK
jgi:hypothetical protein